MKKMNATQRPRRGHNLLEVLLAGFIFAVMVILMIGVWSLYHSAVTKSRNMLVATAYARSIIEKKMGMSYTDLVAAAGVVTEPPISATGQIRGRDFSDSFQAVTNVSKSANPAVDDKVLTIAVVVTWNEETGPKTIRYETKIAKNT